MNHLIDLQDNLYYISQYIAQGEIEMSTRTVRLDARAELTLAALQKQTGLSISGVLKRGLDAYADKVKDEPRRRPIEVLREIGLGPGGDSVASAARAKSAAVRQIRKKHGK